jgi:nucleotide-binding universal stress UspA family protein
MRHGVILAAIDAEPSATSVLRAAVGAAAALDAPIRVLSVIEPLPRVFPGPDIAAQPYVAAERERLAVLHTKLREEAEQLGHSSSLSFCTTVGDATARIREAASEWGACLVVVGYGRRALIDRAFGSGVALKVARDSPSPVLVAPQDTPAHASSVIALVDFSAASLCAAHLAADLAAQGGTIQLLHTTPALNRSLVEESEWRTIYETGARDLLEKLRDRLSARRPDVNVEVCIRAGHPAETAIGLATATKAQLITMGRHAHDLFERLVLGTVSTAVLQHASCAVLVAPPLSCYAFESPEPEYNLSSRRGAIVAHEIRESLS